jgi:hypothetical protein
LIATLVSRGDEKAPKTVCVTVPGTDLQWSINIPDLNRIGPMWVMGKPSGTITRKQCNDLEDFSVQAQAALAAIAM